MAGSVEAMKYLDEVVVQLAVSSDRSVECDHVLCGLSLPLLINCNDTVVLITSNKSFNDHLL